MVMTEIEQFFVGHSAVLPTYDAFVEQLTARFGTVRMKVQKTQISFYNKHLFACVSFMRVRKKKDFPAPYLVLSLGLPQPVHSPRIDIITEPYPGRWTHHIVLSTPQEVDEALMQWVEEAYVFAALK